MQIITMMSYYHVYIRIAKIQKLIIPSVAKDTDQLELSDTASGDVKCYSHSGKESSSLI